MSTNSTISWTEATWNPVTGCDKLSSGCKNCYAARMAPRLQAMGQANYRDGFKVAMHRHVLDVPRKWRKPRQVFVNSMSDLFHEVVPEAFIQQVFQVMQEADWHTYQILTKRSERLLSLSPRLKWASHIWMGVTVENGDYVHRIDHLRASGANLKFLSLEPLLGPLPMLNLKGIDWVITGGESGPHARPLDGDWIRDIRDQCQVAGVPFFFKQWGGVRAKTHGNLLDGRKWEEMPDASHRSQHDKCTNNHRHV